MFIGLSYTADRLEEVGSTETAVDVSAGEVDVALGWSDDGTSLARHAGSKILGNCAATVAETELLAADADNTAVVGARSALAVGGCGVAGCLRSSRRDRLCSWRSGWRNRLGCGSLWLGSRFRRRGRWSTWSKDTTGVERSLGLGRSFAGWRCDGVRGRWWCNRRWLGRSALGGSGGSASRGASHLTWSCTDRVHGRAASTSHGVTKAACLASDDIRARVRVLEVLLLCGGAFIGRKVDDEHVREGRQGLSSACSLDSGGAASDLDGCAVHVELAVTDLVVPGPSESVTTVGDVLRHGYREATRNGCQTGLHRSLWCVAVIRSRRATSDDALDDLPLRVLGGLGVCCNWELAWATTMDSSAIERDLLGLTGIPLVHRVNSIDALSLFAGKVGAFQRGGVESGSAKGLGVGHEDVCGCTGGKRRDGNDFGEHVEVWKTVEVGCCLETRLDLLSDVKIVLTVWSKAMLWFYRRLEWTRRESLALGTIHNTKKNVISASGKI
jgi:hypothetical protein